VMLKQQNSELQGIEKGYECECKCYFTRTCTTK